jgi:aminocarboxymuconate-semialdehyde decarboxylase
MCIGMPAETTLSVCCVLFGGVLERFPKLKLCFAHGCKSVNCIGSLP